MNTYSAKTRYKDNAEAGSYDAKRFKSYFGNLYDRLEKRAARKALASLPVGSHVLDLPCGTGRFAELLLEAGFRVTGADISEAMLDQARGKIEGHVRLEELCVQDAESMSFEDDRFDSVLSIRLLGHIPLENRQTILKEMARVSKGPCILGYSMKTPFTPLRKFLRRILTGKKGAWFPHLVTRKEIDAELGKANMKVLKQFPVATGLDPSRVFLVGKKST